MTKLALIKCDCPECNCPSATTKGVCRDCLGGQHVSHWKDDEPIRMKQGRKLCHDCGQNPCDCARDV